MAKKKADIFFYFAITVLVIFLIYMLMRKSEGFESFPAARADPICRRECSDTGACFRFSGARENDRECWRIYYANGRSCDVNGYKGEVYDSRNSSIMKDKNLPICIGIKYSEDTPDRKKSYLKRKTNLEPTICDVAKGELPYRYVDKDGNDIEDSENICIRLQPVMKGKDCIVSEKARELGFDTAKIISFSNMRDSDNRNVRDSRKDRGICITARLDESPRTDEPPRRTDEPPRTD